jgi:hypothetical protein
VARQAAEEVAGGQERQDEAGSGYPISGATAAGLLLKAFSQALPGQFFVFEALIGQGVGRCQSSAPGKKFIGSFV